MAYVFTTCVDIIIRINSLDSDDEFSGYHLILIMMAFADRLLKCQLQSLTTVLNRSTLT